MLVMKAAMAVSGKSELAIVLQAFERLSILEEDFPASKLACAKRVVDEIRKTSHVPSYVKNECRFILQEADDDIERAMQHSTRD